MMRNSFTDSHGTLGIEIVQKWAIRMFRGLGTALELQEGMSWPWKRVEGEQGSSPA